MRGEEHALWERQPYETSRSYELFCAYRDMGTERSLRKLKDSGKVSVTLRRLEQLSHCWGWVERAGAYDDNVERRARASREKERGLMNERHARIAMLGQSIAVKGLENLLGKVQNGEQVAPGDLSRLVDTSVKVERLARGESTDRREVSGPGGGPVQLEHAFIRAVRRALGFNDPHDDT